MKRLAPRVARTNVLVAQRWLGAAQLDWACPRLLGVVGELPGSAVWHIYEDVGGRELERGWPDRERVAPVVELIANLHSRFAGHELLDECRRHGGDLGVRFFTMEVARSVELLQSLALLEPSHDEWAGLQARLLDRMVRLYDERDERGALFDASGGPDTLLHGDLWTTNAMVVERGAKLEARLVDWDHTGAGPPSYDLSTFLFRFDPEQRPWILGLYREVAAGRGLHLPDDATLNLLFETAEYARYACCLAAAARAASRGERWAFDELAEIDGWFVALEPALALERAG